MARAICLFFMLFAASGTGAMAVQEAQARPNAAPSNSAPPAGVFPVASITVEGNRILSAAGIVAASGLKPGETGNTAVFDAARDRLLATGYFEAVSYRYKAAEKSSGFAISFEVQEMEPLYALKVEALPVTVTEITAWLRTKDPLFTGKVPGTQQVLDRTSREIEEYLKSRGQTASVSGKIVLVSEQHYEAQFMPGAGLPNVALVSFEGNKALRTTDLQNAIAAVAFGQPYTEANFRLLLDNQLKPLYEKNGYMRVAFGKLTTSQSAGVNGIDVHVPITEGAQYKLGDVSVRGADESERKHILRVAKVPKMAVVDFDQLRQAAIRIQNDLKHEGHLDAEVLTDRDINDANKTVDAFFMPTAGPQYLFGKLEVKGLGLDGVAAINKAWAVKPGDPYPGEYPDYFLKRVKEEGWFDNLGETRAEPEINTETHVVNVTIYFRYDPDFKKKKAPRPGEPSQLPSQPPTQPLFSRS